MNVEDLYGLPLAEFVRERNALAKSSGDKDVAKLKKPSSAAWALNQAARTNKGDVARFLHAAGRVRAGGDRSVMAELRTAEADVRRAALHALGASGDAQLAAVNALLAAAAVDESVGQVLAAGTLDGSEEAEASGFVGAVSGGGSSGGGGGGGKSSASDRKPKRDEVREARERKVREQARKKREAAEAACKEAEEEAERLEREADEAEEKADRARRRADAAREKAEALRVALDVE
ncbi:MAG: hypothetical protein QOK43_2060 [Acidimicrobiaceae bacterium]|nr:hypothetical protein [Acidimicrobiaceae bacterium]